MIEYSVKCSSLIFSANLNNAGRTKVKMAEKILESVFSERVKEKLLDCRVTQKQLCKDLQISQGSFSRYMQEGRIPRADILADIACYLHTTSDYLLGRDDNVQNAFQLFAKDTSVTTTEDAKRLADILDGINKSIGY